MKVRTKRWWQWYNKIRKELKSIGPRQAENIATTMQVATIPKNDLRKRWIEHWI